MSSQDTTEQPISVDQADVVAVMQKSIAKGEVATMDLWKQSGIRSYSVVHQALSADGNPTRKTMLLIYRAWLSLHKKSTTKRKAKCPEE